MVKMMVKTFVAVCFLLVLAIPALAQEDYSKIQTSMGYTMLSFPDLATGLSSHHSGFANQTGFNLTKTWGLENYMGIYSLGSGVTLIVTELCSRSKRQGPLTPPVVRGRSVRARARGRPGATVPLIPGAGDTACRMRRISRNAENSSY